MYWLRAPPSPLWGEGWDEGEVCTDVPSTYHIQHPLTLALSPKGRGNLRQNLVIIFTDEHPTKHSRSAFVSKGSNPTDPVSRAGRDNNELARKVVRRPGN